MPNLFGAGLVKIEVGKYVTGRLLWGDGSLETCRVVSTDAHISRDAIIVIHKGCREVMLEQSIIKTEENDQTLYSKNSEPI